MRYPFQRYDPDNPIDVESTVDGIRFVGAGGASDSIPWRDVIDVRLRIRDRRDFPEPFSDILPQPGDLLGSPVAFTCELQFKSHRPLLITHDSADPSSANAYRNLIKDIHQHLLRIAKHRRLRAGYSWGSFLFLLTYSGLFLTAHWWLIPFLVMFGWRRGSDSQQMAALVWRNRPRRYRASRIPKAMLPEATGEPTSPMRGPLPP